MITKGYGRAEGEGVRGAVNERRRKSGGKQSVQQHLQLFEVVAKLSTVPQSPLILPRVFCCQQLPKLPAAAKRLKPVALLPLATSLELGQEQPQQ